MTSLDITDVPPVHPAELAIALRFMAGWRRALLAGESVPESELRHLERAFWQRVVADPHRKLAVLLRFRSLADVLRARRIASLLEQYGPAAIPQLLRAAANQRLNARWGFNPNKMLWQVMALLAEAEMARGTAA